MGADELRERAADAADLLEGAGEVLCLSHYDCDGISAAAVVHEMLERAGVAFEQVFLEELTAESLKEALDGHDHETVLFTDIGSGQTDIIQQLLDDRTVVVVDHHEVRDADVPDIHVNPHLEDIDGGTEVSGAGVTYLVAQQFDEDNQDLAKYAVIGASGDLQLSDEEFSGLNQGFVEDAVEAGVLDVRKGLDIYGRKGKALVKALEYTSDPHLEGLSNDQGGVIRFLDDHDIPWRDDSGDWKSLSELSQEDEQRLVHALITEFDAEELLGDVHILDNGWGVDEFSSLLNACGRLGRAEDGIPICVDDDFRLARQIKSRYGKKIGGYLGMVEDALEDGSDLVREIGEARLIDAGDRIDASMIGTITTICIKSGIIEAPVVVGAAFKDEDQLKLSARLGDGRDEPEMNALMEEVCQELGGEGGGHTRAAGGKIPREHRERFINVMRDSLKESL